MKNLVIHIDSEIEDPVLKRVQGDNIVFPQQILIIKKIFCDNFT